MILRPWLGWLALSLGTGTFLMACQGDGNKGTSSDAGIEARPDAPVRSDDGGVSVLEQHLHPTRDGAYIDPRMTKAAAASVYINAGFPATVVGNVYADPLYVNGWKPGQDAIFIATDQNHVTALDAAKGTQLWDVILGPPAVYANLPCTRDFVYGVLATPVIDLASRTLYVESFQTLGGTTQKHFVYAVSIDDGKTKTGWPVDVAAKLPGFNPSYQTDRGALTILNGTVYLPYASVNADCGTYHGWVVGISTTDPTQVKAYSTRAEAGGIWSSVSSDGTSLFVATGNTAKGTTTWGGGNAMIRFTDGPTFSGAKSDYFTPSNWQTLDTNDWDLGSATAILFDMPGVTPSHLAVAGGKFGVVHLLDRDNLGGVGTGNGTVGEGLYSLAVTERRTGVEAEIRGTAATYTTAKGRYVVIPGFMPTSIGTAITVCPKGMSGNLLALLVTPTSPPKLEPAWCANSGGKGSPIATTTDGTSNALVWVTGAQGAERLLAFDGDTGAVVYAGGGAADMMGSVYEWTSPVDAFGRLFVGGANAVYSFTTP
jgi:hypothetical protein